VQADAKKGILAHPEEAHVNEILFRPRANSFEECVLGGGADARDKSRASVA
jgi:hypothetical protein